MSKMTLTKADSCRGDLILVSPGFALKEEPDTKTMFPATSRQPDVRLNAKASRLLQRLLESIQAGDQIIAVSGFRPRAEQEQIWNNSMKENGSEFTHQFVAVPGHSEHETGLAIDLGENKPPIDFIRPSFPYRGICQRFREKAPQFGFIERYKRGMEPVTGISAEPWHFRYVGFPHSAVITEKGMTLEEYISFLKRITDQKHPYCYQNEKIKVEIFYLPIQEMEEIILPEDDPHQMSGTNEGGVVISVWRTENGRKTI